MGIRNPWRRGIEWRGKKKLKPRRPKPTAPVDMFESDLRARFEVGSPAYRIARNRSGLGYVETQAELARFQGTMVARVFTGRFHVSREPTTLIAMTIVALFGAVIPSVFLIAVFLLERSVLALALLAFGLIEISIGFYALGSLIKSIISWSRRRRIYRRGS